MVAIADYDLQSLLSELDAAGIKTIPFSNHTRYYDMIVKNKEGKFIVKHNNLPSSQMANWRKQYRSFGFNVSTYENHPNSHLTGNVSEVDFVPPKKFAPSSTDIVYKKPRKTAREAMLEKRLQKARQNLFIRLNARLRKENESKENILVYEKRTGLLRFSGDFISASEYVFTMEDSGMWNDTDWVVYLPSKIYERIINHA